MFKQWIFLQKDLGVNGLIEKNCFCSQLRDMVIMRNVIPQCKACISPVKPDGHQHLKSDILFVQVPLF